MFDPVAATIATTRHPVSPAHDTFCPAEKRRINPEIPFHNVGGDFNEALAQLGAFTDTCLVNEGLGRRTDSKNPPVAKGSVQ